MCVPLAAVSAGIGALSAGLSFAGQRQQARQQAALQAQASAAELGRLAAERTSIIARQAQEQEAVGRELEQVRKKSREALSRATVAAGESGVAGASVQALMDDYMRQEGTYRAAVLRQQALREVSGGMALEQAGLASQQRLIAINQPISKPSFLEGALGVASGALGGYRTGLTLKGMMGGGGGGLSQSQQFSSPGMAPVSTYRSSTGGTMLQDGYKLF